MKHIVGMSTLRSRPLGRAYEKSLACLRIGWLHCRGVTGWELSSQAARPQVVELRLVGAFAPPGCADNEAQ